MIDAESENEAAAVCIRTCGDNMEASMIRSILSDAGIRCFVQGEQHRSMLGALGPYIDLRILVSPYDAERAKAILEASDKAMRSPVRAPQDGEQEGFGSTENLVFRVRPKQPRSRTIPALAAGCCGLYLLATGSLVPGGGFLLVGALLFVGNRFAGQSKGGRCSTPSCQERLPEEAKTCPGCDGTVAGDIEHADQRLRALEELRDRRGLPQPPVSGSPLDSE